MRVRVRVRDGERERETVRERKLSVVGLRPLGLEVRLLVKLGFREPDLGV